MPPPLVPQFPLSSPEQRGEADEPKRSRETVWIALAVFLGAAAVLGGLTLWLSSVGDETAATESPGETVSPDAEGEVGGSPGDDAAPAPAPEADGQPTPDDTVQDEPDQSDPGSEGAASEGAGATESSPCPNGTPAEVCEAAAFVEQFRGRPFKAFPTVEFADDAEFQARLLEDFDAEAEQELAVTGDVLRSLGLIDPNADLVEAFRRSLELGVVGFYRTDTDELLIRGNDIDLYAENVIVHELVHAHDDQWFDLDRVELEDVDDERGYAFAALVEGNATRVEEAWKAQLSADERSELARLEGAFFDPDDLAVLQQIPAIVLQLQYSPYLDGPGLVNFLVAEAGGGIAGERAVDEALAAPPVTSEQVLHPELFPGPDPSADVPVPAKQAGDVIDGGVIGELVFDLWLGDQVGDGWNGDQYVTWRDGSTVCTAIHVSADTTAELEEFAGAAGAWARSGPGRQSGFVTIGDQTLVMMQGCI